MYTSHENEKKIECLPRVLHYYRWRRQRLHQQSSAPQGVLVRRQTSSSGEANGGPNECEERRDLQQFNELPEKEIQVRPTKGVYNSAETLQEAIEHSR